MVILCRDMVLSLCVYVGGLQYFPLCFSAKVYHWIVSSLGMNVT